MRGVAWLIALVALTRGVAGVKDSDDESEEDEARHPLIVHDRDPEQNLEALRDPSRFRQNLA